MNLSIALCAHLWVTGRFKVCQANPCLAVRIRRRAGGGCAGGDARLRATGGAAPPLPLWACMEPDQGSADCPLELFGLSIGAAPDHVQSHLAMGRVHAGRGPQAGLLCSHQPTFWGVALPGLAVASRISGQGEALPASLPEALHEHGARTVQPRDPSAAAAEQHLVRPA